MVWVQRVDILYTKASRGAPAATVRNQLPRAFLMHTGGSGSFFFEHYELLERTDFVPKLEERGQASSTPKHLGDLVIEASEDAVRLGLRWNQAIGQPPRRDRLSAIRLVKGRTARLVINGRYASHSGQVYTEATYNVAFDDSLNPDVFLTAREPAVLDMRADLF